MLTGALIAIGIILSRLKSGTLEITSRGVVILLIAGICVFSVDYFSLRAYSKGLSITIGAPILVGGAILVATTLGLRSGTGFGDLRVRLSVLLSGAPTSIRSSAPTSTAGWTVRRRFSR